MFLWFSKKINVKQKLIIFSFTFINSGIFSSNLIAFSRETVFSRFWELVKKQRIKKMDENVDEDILNLASLLFNEVRSCKDIGLKISNDINNLYSLLKKVDEPLTFLKIYPIKNQIRTISNQSKLLRKNGILQVDPLDLDKIDEFCEKLKIELNADRLDLGGAKEKFKYFIYLLLKNYKPIFVASTTSLGLIATFAKGLEGKR